jgi:hypothetical protein
MIPAPRRRSVPSPGLADPSPTDDRSSVFTLVNRRRRQLLLLQSVTAASICVGDDGFEAALGSF